MSMREHLRVLHTNHAEFHTAAAKGHTALAKCFGKSEVEGASDIAAAHESLAAAHMSAAEQAVAACKSLDATAKAMGMGIADDGDGDRFDRIVPDNVRGIISQYPGNTLVPRTGAPSLNKTTNVPLEFAHLVKVGDDEE